MLEKSGGKIATKALLGVVELQSIDGPQARLRILDDGRRSFVEGRRPQLEQMIADALGRPVRIEFDQDSSTAASGVGRRVTDEAHTKALESPLVKQAMELFDAQVIDVEPAEKESGAGEAGAERNDA